MPGYDRETILNSERAYEILRFVRANRSYATEIAKKKDLDRSMVAEIFSQLHKINLIRKVGESKSPQYYEITPKGEMLLGCKDRAEQRRKEAEELDRKAESLVIGDDE